MSRASSRREIGNECFIMNRLDLASMLAEDDNELAALREKLVRLAADIGYVP